MDGVQIVLDRIEDDLQELPGLSTDPWVRMSDGWDALIWPLPDRGAICDPCLLKGGPYLAEQLSDLYGHLSKHRNQGHAIPPTRELTDELARLWQAHVGKEAA